MSFRASLRSSWICSHWCAVFSDFRHFHSSAYSCRRTKGCLPMFVREGKNFPFRATRKNILSCWKLITSHIKADISTIDTFGFYSLHFISFRVLHNNVADDDDDDDGDTRCVVETRMQCKFFWMNVRSSKTWAFVLPTLGLIFQVFFFFYFLFAY